MIAITSAARRIAINAGAEGSIVVGKILEKDQYAYGYDAQNDHYDDLVKCSAGLSVSRGSPDHHRGDGRLPKKETCPYRKPKRWPETANRMNLTADGGVLQTDLVRIGRTFPIAGLAAGTSRSVV